MVTTTSIDPQVPAERGRDATTGGLRGGTTAAEASDGKHARDDGCQEIY